MKRLFYSLLASGMMLSEFTDAADLANVIVGIDSTKGLEIAKVTDTSVLPQTYVGKSDGLSYSATSRTNAPWYSDTGISLRDLEESTNQTSTYANNREVKDLGLRRTEKPDILGRFDLDSSVRPSDRNLRMFRSARNEDELIAEDLFVELEGFKASLRDFGILVNTDKKFIGLGIIKKF